MELIWGHREKPENLQVEFLSSPFKNPKGVE